MDALESESDKVNGGKKKLQKVKVTMVTDTKNNIVWII